MQRLSLRVDNSVCISSSGAGANVSKELASLHSTLKELRQEIQELRSKPPLRYEIMIQENKNNIIRDGILLTFYKLIGINVMYFQICLTNTDCEI